MRIDEVINCKEEWSRAYTRPTRLEIAGLLKQLDCLTGRMARKSSNPLLLHRKRDKLINRIHDAEKLLTPLKHSTSARSEQASSLRGSARLQQGDVVLGRELRPIEAVDHVR